MDWILQKKYFLYCRKDPSKGQSKKPLVLYRQIYNNTKLKKDLSKGYKYKICTLWNKHFDSSPNTLLPKKSASSTTSTRVLHGFSPFHDNFTKLRAERGVQLATFLTLWMGRHTTP
jgi:hypothetical protein